MISIFLFFFFISVLYHNPKVPGCLEYRLKSNWKICVGKFVWKNLTKQRLSFGMLRTAACNLGSLATHARFHSHRKRKRAIGKETKHKVRTSDKRKWPIMQPHCCSPDPALMSLQPRSRDILQFSALAAYYSNCRCLLCLDITWVSDIS